ncbi:hypothetical protein ACEWY4_020631 [Coilia grayii]|uniref:Microtubule-associated protein 10 C-terminal domain-containing protein n=1 Tax=Coilia grayii TaxID=363190 RepID=A0ABD1J6P9_9TELE
MTVPSHKHESLFSFEFLVEYVSLETGLFRSWEPAVGVRLLDFPTLVIYQSDIDAHADGTLLTSTTDVKSNEAIFQKGKSCLFKMNLGFLQKHLSYTPLYAMVMDVGQDTPKLIGSSLISLARLVDQIKADVEAYGIGTPSACGERGVHDLCNLMGRKIGQISIACKLVSLGGSLIPHIPENRIHSVGIMLSQETKGTETAEAVGETTGVMALQQEGSCHAHVICQNVKLEGQPTEVVVSEAEQTPVAAVSTQTEPTQKRIKKIEIARIKYEEEPDPALFCPPPMFYSALRQKDNDEKNIEITIAGTDSLTLADLDAINDSSDSEILPLQEQRGRATAEHSAGSQIPPLPPGPSSLGSADTIRQLPLLNALLVELSVLNGQSQQQQQPLSIHPNLAWLYTSAQGPTHPAIDSTNPASETQRSDTSPQQQALQSSYPRQGRSERCAKSLTSNSTSIVQRKAKASRHSPHPEKAKRKLTYGLTHTYRLRLQRLSADLPKPRECMELIHSKQPKPTKHKNKNLCSNSSILKRSLHLDENIKTLVHSINVDGTLELSPPKPADKLNTSLLSSASGNLSSHIAASVPRLTPKEKPVHFEQDKELHIRIPSALSQQSDLEKPHRHTSSLSEHKPDDPGVTSGGEEEGEQGDDGWSAPSSELSGPSSGSVDHVDYQDDFTSLDPSDGYSPDPLSSPEPRMSRAHSDPSSLHDDSVRKAALPTPVKAVASPKRSLKGTHLIRQSTQASGLSVSSDGDEVRSGYTPSALSRHSQMRSSPGSQGSELGGLGSVLRNATRRGKSERRDCAGDVTQSRGYSEDSFARHNGSDPESPSVLDLNDTAEEEHDELGTLGLTKKYQHISDLMAKRLPGYTL